MRSPESHGLGRLDIITVLSIVLAFVLAAIWSYERFIVEAPVAVKMSVPPEEPLAKPLFDRSASVSMESWFEASGQREVLAMQLQKVLRDNLCAPILHGQSVALVASPRVIFSLPGRYQTDESGTKVRLSHAVMEPPVEDGGDVWLDALTRHLDAFASIRLCEVHTDGFLEYGDGSMQIKVKLDLVGESQQGQRLQEFMRARVGFLGDPPQLTRFIVVRSDRAVAPTPIFQNETEKLLGGVSLPPEVIAAKFGPAEPVVLDFGGLSVVDVDGDGQLDIYVTRSGPNLFFRRNADGVFVDEASAWGLADADNGRGAVFADFDGDGDLDLILANLNLAESPGGPVRIYRRMERGFEDWTQRAFGKLFHGAYTQVSVGDVDGDDDLDIFVAQYADRSRARPNHFIAATNGGANLLLVNAGDFTFTDEAASRGLSQTGWSYAAGFSDHDEDGDSDLYVANDFGPNHFYENLGDGRFEERANQYGIDHRGAGMGVTWLDANGDGRLDLYVTNMYSNAGSRIAPYARLQSDEVRDAMVLSAQGNGLFLNDGAGRFRETTDEYRVRDTGWAWASVAFDYDRDGDEDLYVANGYHTGKLKHDF